MYFLVDALNALDRVYHYSMANFVLAMHKGTPLLLSPALLACTWQPFKITWLPYCKIAAVNRLTCLNSRMACRP